MSVSTSLGRRFPSSRGDIVEIVFVGKYPHGSDGNEDAARMWDGASGIISAEKPAGVLFNFLGLKYRWGDSIGNLATTVFNKKDRSILPACFLAKGKTARSLEWFFNEGMPFTIFEIGLFTAEHDALDFLHRRIGDDTGRTLG